MKVPVDCIAGVHPRNVTAPRTSLPNVFRRSRQTTLALMRSDSGPLRIDEWPTLRQLGEPPSSSGTFLTSPDATQPMTAATTATAAATAWSRLRPIAVLVLEERLTSPLSKTISTGDIWNNLDETDAYEDSAHESFSIVVASWGAVWS